MYQDWSFVAQTTLSSRQAQSSLQCDSTSTYDDASQLTLLLQNLFLKLPGSKELDQLLLRHHEQQPMEQLYEQPHQLQSGQLQDQSQEQHLPKRSVDNLFSDAQFSTPYCVAVGIPAPSLIPSVSPRKKTREIVNGTSLGEHVMSDETEQLMSGLTELHVMLTPKNTTSTLALSSPSTPTCLTLLSGTCPEQLTTARLPSGIIRNIDNENYYVLRDIGETSLNRASSTEENLNQPIFAGSVRNDERSQCQLPRSDVVTSCELAEARSSNCELVTVLTETKSSSRLPKYGEVLRQKRLSVSSGENDGCSIKLRRTGEVAKKGGSDWLEDDDGERDELLPAYSPSPSASSSLSSTSNDTHTLVGKSSGGRGDLSACCLSGGLSFAITPIDLEQQERIKLERKRARNRIAATRCREKKVEKIETLEEQIKDLKERNVNLIELATTLRENICQLKVGIVQHVNSGCPLLLQQLQQQQPQRQPQQQQQQLQQQHQQLQCTVYSF